MLIQMFCYERTELTGAACNARLSIEMPVGEISKIDERTTGELTSSGVGCLINTNKAVTQFEHVIPSDEMSKPFNSFMRMKNVPERDDDKLRILSSVLDVVGNYGDVTEVQRSVNLVHKVERSGLWRRHKLETNVEVMTHTLYT